MTATLHSLWSSRRK